MSGGGSGRRRWYAVALALIVLAAAPRPDLAAAGDAEAAAAAERDVVVAAESAEAPPDLEARPSSCDVCEPPEGAPVRSLAEAQIDSIGRDLSQINVRLWARTDSLYQAGVFGRVGDDEAREAARCHFMLRAASGFDYLVRLTAGSNWARSDEASMTRPFGQWYANTAVYPLRFLHEAWTGPGGFCMKYDLGPEFDERMQVGGIPVRVRSDRIRGADGSTTPAICLEMGSALHKSVDLLYAERHCGLVRRETIVDRGDTLELVTMDSIEGMYARKAGTHRLAAVAVWRSCVSGDRDPARPRIGAIAYFPQIQIRLSLLPDLGLDDLRDFDVPQPVCATAWTGKEPRKEWIRVKSGAVFAPWGAVGPRPAILDQRYPDL